MEVYEVEVRRDRKEQMEGSAREMLRVLKKFLNGEPVPEGEPPTFWEDRFAAVIRNIIGAIGVRS